ncbi:MAG: hypothetical protein KA123_03255 [Candidatus Eisenbacteria bacterium]|nr:hypothetical protein [Candidatus Eisenbacteria bacterium]
MRTHASRRSTRGLLLAGILAAFLPAVCQAGDEGLADHISLLERLSAEAADEILSQLQFPAGTKVHVVPESPSPTNWLVAAAIQEKLLAAGCDVVVPSFGEPTAAPVVAEVKAQGGGGKQGGKITLSLDSMNGAGAETEDESEDQEQTAGGPTGDDEALEAGESADSLETQAEEPVSTPAQNASSSATTTPSGATGGATGSAEGTFSMVLPKRGEVLSFRVVECGISYPWAKRTMWVGPRRYGRMACVRLRATRLTEPGHVVSAVASSDRMYLDSFPGWARTMLEGREYPFPIEQPGSTPVRAIIEPLAVAGIVSGLVYLFYENQK